MAAVVVDKLSKSYGEITAVVDVSFEVARGEVFALLGPNGAGKTTTIEILEGFRKRDSGRVEVLGIDPAVATTSRQLRERLGVVLQELAVEPYLSVRQALARSAGFYPAPLPVAEVIEQVGLTEKADARVKTLSGGQLRRLDLGLGIIGNPEVIFLDEPTTGFDPSARRGAWDVVRALTDRGTTVLLTTHYMEEADELADRVAVISKGAIVADGTPRSLGGRDIAEAVIKFRLGSDHSASDLPFSPTGADDGVIELKTSEEIAMLRRLTNWAAGTGAEIIGLTVERLTLEDVYLRLTGFEDSAGDVSE